MMAPDIGLHALRRQLSAAHDLRIDKDDPIHVAMVFKPSQIRSSPKNVPNAMMRTS